MIYLARNGKCFGPFSTDELTKIPTSRDPFALMRSVPGVLVDRVNIGEIGRAHV